MNDTALVTFFLGVEDPRLQRGKRHRLLDIMVIAVCAVVCGCQGWAQIEEWAEGHEEWLKTFLDLPHGIPSADTFARVFSIINAEQFELCFSQWAREVNRSCGGKLIAIEGKTIRRSFDTAAEKSAIHLVSAWSVENQVVLAQVKVDNKSNEITAIPRLLDLLNLKGTTVTIDAMGCQTAIALQIVNKGGDYVFSLKGNQGTIHEEVKEFFEDERKNKFKDVSHDTWEITEKGHGRIEERFYLQSGEVKWMEDRGKWKDLKSIGFVDSKRIIGEKTSEETRYFLSSLPQDAAQFAKAVRGHWGIENGLHWCLDVVMNEDQSRIRVKNAAENFAVLRRIALNLLKKAPHKKKRAGMASKSRLCNWNRDYLLQVLFGSIEK